jgi:hypothetical protein
MQGEQTSNVGSRKSRYPKYTVGHARSQARGFRGAGRRGMYMKEEYITQLGPTESSSDEDQPERSTDCDYSVGRS